MQKVKNILKQENGFVLVTALVIMLLLIVIGISSTNTTSIGLQISGNERRHSMAFYAAEASRAHVQATTGLYGSQNVILNQGVNFPDGSTYPASAQSANPQLLGADQSFRGNVIYKGSSTSHLRGSGFEVGSYKAHIYEMTCTGYGPDNTNAESQVQAGFYRIGF